MTENEILSKAAETFTDKAKIIKVPIEPKNRIEKLMIKMGWKKGYIEYPVRKILYGNRIRIAAKAVRLPVDVFKGKNLIEALMESSLAYNEDLIYIAAVAIQNDRHEPSKTLLDQLRWVDDSVFAEILDKSLNMFDVQSFMKSIALIKGTETILKRDPEITDKASLQDTRETIARGEKSRVTGGTSG